MGRSLLVGPAESRESRDLSDITAITNARNKLGQNSISMQPESVMSSASICSGVESYPRG